MRKMPKFLALALFALLLAALMVACGDATATSAPAAKPTEAAIAKAQPTADATVKPTAVAMVKPNEATLVRPTDTAVARPTTAATTMPTADVVAIAKPTGPLSGDFNNQGAEPVAGKATLGKTSEGKFVLRFENLKSAPGPNLFVYLTQAESPSTNDQIKMGLEVGKLKATQGSLNYELDSSLDLNQYKAVAVYCKSFRVVFGYANLKADVS